MKGVRAARQATPPTSTIAAKADAGIASLADHVRKVVDGLPPLTPEQRAKLAALFASGSGYTSNGDRS